ncbi:hypothetical protein LTR36_007402 [Oleoguttula mirabilis]|uniref:C2 NT-type domain-containing protein n=1 Tax=Oleoguttula mirabilis TaxID=1507867 RepID=A0AAV9J9M9_9PEZI|nr:hypothetical protein LTR36_007402 [Oleoguttula mirabilis]
MTAAFIPKSRRARFTLTLSIHDLNNVPLVSGTSFLKWHLPASTAAEHRGRTPKCAIKDHRVLYNYAKTLPVRLTVGKDGMLNECLVQFEVLQEYSAGGRGERICLGRISLNLAEYVESEEQAPSSPGGGSGAGKTDETGITRRYLMQDSKINSTLKIGIYMKHIDGTRDYYAPPLKTAPVFGGIAGIISSSEAASTAHAPPSSSHTNGEAAEDGTAGAAMPSLSSTNREMGEMQDMYRRTLAAFWASQPGELKADECIEDIFSGGDGWGKHGQPGQEGLEDGAGAQGGGGGGGSGSSTPAKSDGEGRHRRADSGASKMGMGAQGRGIMGVAGHHPKNGQFAGSKGMMPRKGAGEIDEFDVRDDLKSWRIGERAYG